MKLFSIFFTQRWLSLPGVLLFMLPLVTNAATQDGKVQTTGKLISGVTVKLFHPGISVDGSAELLGLAKTNPGGRQVVVFLGLEKPVKAPMVGYSEAL